MGSNILQKSNVWSEKKTKDNAIEVLGVIGLRKYYYHKKKEAEQKYREECRRHYERDIR